MASSEATNLSLDDIIRKNKSSKAGQRRGSGIQNRPIQKRHPKKWDNDKFEEVYGKGRRGSRTTTIVSSTTVCRLANVPYNVSQEELETLFEKYNLSKVTLHYNFQGRSLGTAELQGPRQVISRIERDFAGVEIDGRPLHMTVMGGNNNNEGAKARVTRPAARQGGGGRTGGRSAGPKKTQKPKLTAAELDKELEDYMKDKSA